MYNMEFGVIEHAAVLFLHSSGTACVGEWDICSFPFSSSLKSSPKISVNILLMAAVHFASGFHPSVTIALAFVHTSDLGNH